MQIAYHDNNSGELRRLLESARHRSAQVQKYLQIPESEQLPDIFIIHPDASIQNNKLLDYLDNIAKCIVLNPNTRFLFYTPFQTKREFLEPRLKGKLKALDSEALLTNIKFLTFQNKGVRTIKKFLKVI